MEWLERSGYKKVNNKYFILLNDKYVEIEGERVENNLGLDLFKHQDYFDKEKWHISEGATGKVIVSDINPKLHLDTKTREIKWDAQVQEIKEILNTSICVSPRYKKANKRKKKQNHIYSEEELKDLGLTLIEIDNVEYVELERETRGKSTKLKRKYTIKKDYFESLSDKNKKLLLNT